EHPVVILVREGDPDQPLRRRCQQQLADRAVDDPIGDLDETFSLRRGLQATVQVLELRGVDGRCGGGESVNVSGVGHDRAPFTALPGYVLRRVSSPSAAALLAASTVPPSIVAISS